MPAHNDPTELIPLSSVAFEILLSLSTQDRHGYAIMRAVEERSDGQVRLHAGSLYRALARLMDAELIQEIEPPAEETDQRRRYYRITALGGRVAVAEASRLERQVRAARAAGLLRRA